MKLLAYWLSDFENTKNIELGGKAKNLTRLIYEGFNVPDGFVVTGEMQKVFFKRNGIDKMVLEEIDNINSNIASISSNAGKRIRDSIIKSEFTSEELDSINSACNKLFKGEREGSVAVRSSASIEDGETSSWAGQFDSFLNVDIEDISNYIKRCWASLFGSRALQYGIANLIKNEIPSFSVIVQIMINGDCSGVAFSTDPVDNDSSHVRVEAVSGSGEKAVGGQEVPYSVVLSKEDGLIVKRTFGSEGRVELLKPSILKELMDEVVKIEKLFGMPVDVEWTVSDSEVLLLQARPITSMNNKKKKDTNELLPDILEYELTFKVAGLGFMFADLLCGGFGYLHPLFICHEGEFLQYFTNERMEYAARYGHRWLSKPNGFDEYRKEFTEFHNTTYDEMEKTLNNSLTVDSVKVFFEYIYKYFTYYSKMDFQFTNLTYLYAEENFVIKNSLNSLSEFKDIARVWINEVSIDDDCLLNRIMVKLSDQFNISLESLDLYKISEIVDLFDGKTTDKRLLKDRAISAVVMYNGQSTKYVCGKKSKEYFESVKEIKNLQSKADIIGQVANRGPERFVLGYARLINVDYSNIDELDYAIEEMNDGEILVSEFTAPELMAACNKAKAIVTDLGGMLSHAAIVSREIGIPCIVGTEHASISLENGQKIKIDLDLGIVEKI